MEDYSKLNCKNCFFYRSFNIMDGKDYDSVENSQLGEECMNEIVPIRIEKRNSRPCKEHVLSQEAN